MEPIQLTKEDIDKVRNIEGFPIATDGEIIRHSDAPRYTACPNPFIGDFISRFGKTYNEKTDCYKVEPFASDVIEGKSDPIYNIHTYHTKVPPKAIISFIEHYTEPGDIVLDVFSGSGMTGVAAQTCPSGKRNAILVDISPYATFLEANYNEPNRDHLIEEIEKQLDDVEQRFAKYYRTKHIQNGVVEKDILGNPVYGNIDYTVWSDVFFCPHCGHEMVFYDVALDEKKKAKKIFNCTKCNCELSKKNILLKKTQDIDGEGKVFEYVQKVPVLINYTIGGTRYLKEPDEEDLSLLNSIVVNTWVPTDELPSGYNTEQPKHSHGMNWVNSFYPKRVQIILGELYKEFCEDNKKMFLFTSVLPKLTLLNRYMPEYDNKEHKFRALVGPMAGTYYVPALSAEHNVIKQFRFQLSKLKKLNYEKGNVIVSTQSATDLTNIPENSIDYVFIDPPFGANIMYSELNYMPESWLKIKTNNNQEAIMNDVQKKKLAEYTELMTRSLREVYRVLKPNRWLTIEFHNSKNAVWNGIQESIQAAGFIIADVRTINKKKKTVMQLKSDNTVDMDLAISAYKPSESLKSNMIKGSGTEDSAWVFINQHLEKLPIVVDADNDGKIDILRERQSELLFDRMVAYHIMNGIPIPLDAPDFYKGLDERYLKRDSMYFLADQVNEYDTARIKMDVELVQLAFFVTNEKTAIGWLYQKLSSPMTYAELQPEFMKEVKTIDKYEDIPELAELLEENFLQDESGKWYIPDVTKEGDVIKLREKKLIKEFEGYMQSKGKLKLFRSEAIRAGFSMLWKDKNYQAIVDMAQRLPDTTIQEDQNLLMYYDISLSRI